MWLCDMIHDSALPSIVQDCECEVFFEICNVRPHASASKLCLRETLKQIVQGLLQMGCPCFALFLKTTFVKALEKDKISLQWSTDSNVSTTSLTAFCEGMRKLQSQES